MPELRLSNIDQSSVDGRGKFCRLRLSQDSRWDAAPASALLTPATAPRRGLFLAGPTFGYGFVKENIAEATVRIRTLVRSNGTVLAGLRWFA